MIRRIFNFQFSIFNIKLSGRNILKHPLFSGSFIMIVGSNVANFFAYLYHLVLGRMLGPSAYSELAATLAALGLFSTAFVFLGMVVVKFAASSKDSEKGELFRFLMNFAVKTGMVGVIIFIVVSPLISRFLHISVSISILIGPILFVLLLTFLFKSFLQGLLKFGSSVSLTVIDIAGRLVLGAMLVYLGYSAFGGILGILLGSLMSLFAGLYLLRDFRLSSKNQKFKQANKLFAYAIPIVIVSVANNSFIATDVILAKHYFNPHLAGIYASLSILGKIIFYGTAPVASVMFPLVAKYYTQGKNYKKLLFLSLLLTGVISMLVLLIYIFFPRLMITILFGSAFLEAAPDLFWFGIFMSFYTLANVFISFYLSIEKTKIIIFPVIFAIMQIVGIIFYHNSILNLIHISSFSTALLFLSLLLYFLYDKRKNSIKV